MIESDNPREIEGRRTTPAGLVLVTGLIALGLGTLLNASSLLKTAERQPLTLRQLKVIPQDQRYVEIALGHTTADDAGQRQVEQIRQSFAGETLSSVIDD